MTAFRNIILVTLTLFILFIGTLPILEHFDWGVLPGLFNNLYEPSDSLMLWSRIYLFLYSLFAAFSFEVVSKYSNKKFMPFTEGTPYMDIYAKNKRASWWFSWAMYTWAFAALIKILFALKDIQDDLVPSLIVVVTSSFNSMFLLWGVLCLDLDFSSARTPLLFKGIWKKISENPKTYRSFVLIITLVITVFEAVLVCFKNNNGKIEFLPDMILSAIACFLIGTGLYNIFVVRNLKDFGVIALITAFTILMAQTVNLYDLFMQEQYLLSSIKTILSLAYTSFLITLLFALELSWLGWRKNKIIEKKNNELSNIIEELEKAKEKDKDQQLRIREVNEEITNKKRVLEVESEINRGFILLASQSLQGNSLKEVLYYCLDLLKNKQVYDYAFAVGIFNLFKGQIEFPYYLEHGEEKKDKNISINNTFGGYAFTQNKEVIVPDVFDPQMRASFGVSELGYVTAPNAKSLIYIPLIKDSPNAIPFGVMTLQSDAHREYTQEDLALIRAIAYLLGQLLNPDSIY